MLFVQTGAEVEGGGLDSDAHTAHFHFGLGERRYLVNIHEEV